MSSDKKNSAYKVIAQNRKARHNYHIEEELEAGIVLKGSEVKSLRNGESNITDSYAEVKDGEAFLINCYIKEYEQANRENHESRRVRKLLLHKKQIKNMMAAVMRKGMTIVTLKIYFNDKNRAKVMLGIAKGKKLHDKRASDKDKDWKRQQGRLLKSDTQ
ncbi:MAG: SsrA-binding protein SmpB [Kordiimonadaceae bacterium]|jgi:SsrA-binding protein|nr:SsrA-binding protein SmpB [Kordiimonadaceae bacterium]MBT6035828.1 SsrA-binding protein SmpB [Kordiimonadaceae bacterium]MBT6330398.1 SsrA-binding protein SmpB [Kordiimonadaceae bacterium]MBT7583839.1 SsrA-binding protein SmpB [Kordiimonadaceae bacterium]